MDAIERRARHLLAAAAQIREDVGYDDRLGGEPARFYDLDFYEGVATMLEVEGNLRLTQPRGFYEVEAADLIANAILPPEESP